MLDDLEPTVRTAVMSILAALYESGMVEEVEMGDVLRLFGVPDNDPGINSARFLFSDPAWIDAYIDFKDSTIDNPTYYLPKNKLEELDEFDELLDSDDEFVEPGDLDSDRKIH